MMVNFNSVTCCASGYVSGRITEAFFRPSRKVRYDSELRSRLLVALWVVLEGVLLAILISGANFGNPELDSGTFLSSATLPCLGPYQFATSE